MLSYYLSLGWRHLRRSPALTLLVILTLAAGVAASMSTLTVLYMMSADPLPQKSDRVLVATLDNLPLQGPDANAEVPDYMTWTDVRNLRNSDIGKRRTGIYGINTIVTPADASRKPFFGDGVAVDDDFFAMMDTPFMQGSGWGKEHDNDASRVAVIGSELAEKLFGADTDAVGRSVRVNNVDLRIVGVLDHWAPMPSFFAMGGGRSDTTDLFLPLSTALDLQMQVNGNISCFEDHDPGFEGLMNSECIWLRFWVEAESPSGRKPILDKLQQYVQSQKALGRLPREDRSELYNVREWLAKLKVVDDDTVVQTWLAFGFLAVCLVNTIGLLLAKFGARAGDIAVRRALGASRIQIFSQYIAESAVLGLVGSILGVALTLGLLKVLAAQSEDLAAVAQMDVPMLIVTVALSIAAAIIAGLLPTWRATQIPPALQLKTQ